MLLALGVCQFIARFSTPYYFFKFYVCVFGVFSLDPINYYHCVSPNNVNYVYRVFVFIVFGVIPIIKVSRKTVFTPFY